MSNILESIVQEKSVSMSVRGKKEEMCYEGLQCSACCHNLNIDFKDQKPTITPLGGNGPYCFIQKTSRD